MFQNSNVNETNNVKINLFLVKEISWIPLIYAVTVRMNMMCIAIRLPLHILQTVQLPSSTNFVATRYTGHVSHNFIHIA